MDDEGRVLEYGTSRRWSRRRIVRWGGVTLCACVVVLVAWVYSRPWRVQGRYLFLQHECMVFERPADQVMFEEDEKAGLMLYKQGGGYVRGYFGGIPRAKTQVVAVAFLSEPCSELHWTGSNTSVFLHGRRSPAGHERLVNVSVHSGFGDGGDGRWVPFCYSVGTPATWALGSQMTQASFIPKQVWLSCDDRLRVYAGQADAKDESHFTMRYEINGAGGMIDGWLMDNDGIRIEFRDGPATTRPTKMR
jgi:hypothetical protein